MSTPTTSIAPAELSVPVVGMTCASCVNRIERYLSRAEGVSDATVNLATERATVRFDPAVIDRTGIVAAIEAAGYDVGRESAGDAAADVDAAELERAAERRELLFQAIASLVIGGVMMAIMFWPGGTPWPIDRHQPLVPRSRPRSSSSSSGDDSSSPRRAAPATARRT